MSIIDLDLVKINIVQIILSELHVGFVQKIGPIQGYLLTRKALYDTISSIDTYSKNLRKYLLIYLIFFISFYARKQPLYCVGRSVTTNYN